MGKTIVSGRFEWDEEKNLANIEKHGFGFDFALSMFDDNFRIERYDREHSSDEEKRFLSIGTTMDKCIIITVVHTERGKRTRLISARRASTKERNIYYERLEKFYSGM